MGILNFLQCVTGYMYVKMEWKSDPFRVYMTFFPETAGIGSLNRKNLYGYTGNGWMVCKMLSQKTLMSVPVSLTEGTAPELPVKPHLQSRLFFLCFMTLPFNTFARYLTYGSFKRECTFGPIRAYEWQDIKIEEIKIECF